ncbi:MAG: hypothetical protein ACJA08_002977 [Cyclobacteriaceae bacterium]|jgi:hypothetical protein
MTESGGATPILFSLDGGTTTQSENTFQSIADFPDLGEDSYTVTAKDANGCLGSVLAIITEPDALAISVIQSDGDFAITASGGTAPYEYSSDRTTFQTGSAFTDLDPGAYAFRVMDANGCEVTSSSFTIVLELI